MKRLYIVIAIIALVVVLLAVGVAAATGGGWFNAEPASSGQAQTRAAP